MVEYYIGQEKVDIEKDADEYPRSKYFVNIFRGINEIIKSNFDLKFYLVSSIGEIPEHGDKVIAVVTQDEYGRPPKYTQDIGITFKCFGTSPTIELKSLNINILNFYRLLSSVRNVSKSVPYKFLNKCKVIGKKFTGEAKSNIYDMPIGYYNQNEKNIKNIEERKLDLFFSGGVGKKRYGIKTPKMISRNRMLMKTKEIKNEGNLNVFVKESKMGEEGRLSEEEYSSKMMDSKISLVPRGNNVETWRLFESARYGCVTITEPLPKRWYFEEAPFLEVDDWNNLGQILEYVLKDKRKLNNIHMKTLKWWENLCSEGSVAKFMSDKIKKKYNIKKGK